MALTHALSTNNYGEAHLLVATSAANGTHTTLAGALADAVSGDTVFLRDSVTENVTIPAGINITAWQGGTLNTPTITGKITMTAAGTSSINGIRLVTNSDFIISVTGSAASILNVNDCYLNCTNNTGINYTTSGLAALTFTNCKGDLGTTGIAYFVSPSNGTIDFINCIFEIIKEKAARDQRDFILKRCGTAELAETEVASEIRGMYFWEDQGKLFYAASDHLYVYDYGTSTVSDLGVVFANTTGEVGFTEYLFDTNVVTLVASDGVNIYQVDTANAVTSCSDPAPPPVVQLNTVPLVPSTLPALPD